MSDESDYETYTKQPEASKKQSVLHNITAARVAPSYGVQKVTGVKQNAYLDQKNVKTSLKPMFISGFPIEHLKLAATQLGINDYSPGIFQLTGEEYFKFNAKSDEEVKKFIQQGQGLQYKINEQVYYLVIGLLDTHALNNINCYIIVQLQQHQITNIKNIYQSFDPQDIITVRKISDWYLVCFSQEEKAISHIQQHDDQTSFLIQRFNDKYYKVYTEYIQQIKAINQKQQQLQQQQYKIQGQQKYQLTQQESQKQEYIIYDKQQKFIYQPSVPQNINAQLQNKAQQLVTELSSVKYPFSGQKQPIKIVASPQQAVDDQTNIKISAQKLTKAKAYTQNQDYSKLTLQQQNEYIQQAIQRQQNELIKLNKQSVKTHITQFINQNFDLWLQSLTDGAEEEILRKMDDAEKYQFGQYEEQINKFNMELISLQERARTIVTGEINNVLAKTDTVQVTVEMPDDLVAEARAMYRVRRTELEKTLTADIAAVVRSIEALK